MSQHIDPPMMQASVVDNLTTNDGTKALSAAQGYALNNKIDHAIISNSGLETYESIKTFLSGVISDMKENDYKFVRVRTGSDTSLFPFSSWTDYVGWIQKQNSPGTYWSSYLVSRKGTDVVVACDNGTITARSVNGSAMVSDSNKNFASVVSREGNYTISWTYPTDTSAYLYAFVHKQSGQNPVVTVLANNKLTVGAVNSGGTIVPLYNGTGVSGVLCFTTYLGIN